MNLYAIPNLLAAIFAITIGLFVLLKNIKSKTSLSFFYLALSTFIWQLGTTLTLLAEYKNFALIGTRVSFFGIALIPVASYHITANLLEIRGRKAITFGYLLAFLLFIPLSWTPLILNGVYEYSWGYFFKAGPFHPIFMIFFISFMLAVFINLFASYKKETNPLKKNRIKYFFIAIFIAYFGSVDYLATYGISVYPFGYFLVICCVLILAYAIVNYRLMDIEVIIRETAVFAGIFGFAVGAFVLVMQVGQMFLEPYISDNPFVFPAMALFLVTIAVRPIEKLTYNTVGKFLFKKRQKYQKALKDAAEGMATIRKPQRLLGLITHIISKNLRPTNVAVYVFDEEKKTYSVSAARYPSKIDKNLEFSNEEPLISHLMENKQPVVFEEVEHWLKEEQAQPHKEVLASDLASIKDKLSSLNVSICIPSFYHKNELLGFLVLGDKKSGDLYAQDDLELLDSLADEAGIAIRNSMLYIKLQHKEEEVSQIYEREQTMFMHAAHAFANAIDARDPYTHGHSQRVTKYSLALVDQMEEARFGSVEKHKWFKQRLQLAGLLHDIGKIATPDSILQKNGKLNDEEWKKMKEHPVIGANVLSYVRGLWDIVPAVKYHHERYDGKGYPDGLKQENIPFMARIMSVADVFDAMTSNRPYRKAKIAEESKQEINNNSATQFDPYTVGAFMKAYAKSLITKIMEQDR